MPGKRGPKRCMVIHLILWPEQLIIFCCGQHYVIMPLCVRPSLSLFCDNSTGLLAGHVSHFHWGKISLSRASLKQSSVYIERRWTYFCVKSKQDRPALFRPCYTERFRDDIHLKFFRSPTYVFPLKICWLNFIRKTKDFLRYTTNWFDRSEEASETMIYPFPSATTGLMIKCTSPRARTPQSRARRQPRKGHKFKKRK